MLSVIDILFLAIALAMDCFAVSIVSGVIIRKWESTEVRLAVLFGVFQALMPLIGWYGISYFSNYIAAVDHWFAFGLLVLVGGNMVRENFGKEEEKHFDPQKWTTQLVLAVATSIDALAVGISFGCTGYSTVEQMAGPLLVIGLMSFAFSIAGSHLGIHFGRLAVRRIKPELVGGVILILIGVKVLVTHLF